MKKVLALVIPFLAACSGKPSVIEVDARDVPDIEVGSAVLEDAGATDAPTPDAAVPESCDDSHLDLNGHCHKGQHHMDLPPKEEDGGIVSVLLCQSWQYDTTKIPDPWYGTYCYDTVNRRLWPANNWGETRAPVRTGYAVTVR